MATIFNESSLGQNSKLSGSYSIEIDMAILMRNNEKISLHRFNGRFYQKSPKNNQSKNWRVYLKRGGSLRAWKLVRVFRKGSENQLQSFDRRISYNHFTITGVENKCIPREI